MNCVIQLSALPSDDLSWQEEQNIASKAGGKIHWSINLGIDPVSCSLTEEGIFQQRAMALTTFAKEIWPKFQAVTECVILATSALYRKIDPLDECEWDLDVVEEPLRSRMQAMGMFMEYIHRLASYLPDAVPASVQVDVRSAKNKSDVVILLSKERFRHITMDVVGWAPEQKSTIGVVIPEDAFCSPDTLRVFEELLLWVETNHGNFRAVPESLLNEEWDGIDLLIFYAPATTLLGKRKALGFAASGGKIVSYGGTIGVEGEERVG